VLTAAGWVSGPTLCVDGGDIMHASLLLCAAVSVAAILGCQPGKEHTPSAALTLSRQEGSRGLVTILHALSRLG
jgi:hypothetical protein